MYSALILFVPLLLAAFACLGYLHLFAKIRLSPLQYLIIPSILPAVVLQAGIPVNDTFSTLLYLILEAARDYLLSVSILVFFHGLDMPASLGISYFEAGTLLTFACALLIIVSTASWVLLILARILLHVCIPLFALVIFPSHPHMDNYRLLLLDRMFRPTLVHGDSAPSSHSPNPTSPVELEDGTSQTIPASASRVEEGMCV